MNIQNECQQFMKLCRRGKNCNVMRTMYTPDIVSVEGDGKDSAGQLR